jgi:hypothetical protein
MHCTHCHLATAAAAAGCCRHQGRQWCSLGNQCGRWHGLHRARDGELAVAPTPPLHTCTYPLHTHMHPCIEPLPLPRLTLWARGGEVGCLYCQPSADQGTLLGLRRHPCATVATQGAMNIANKRRKSLNGASGALVRSREASAT